MISFREKRIFICKEIAASPEAVWDVLTDTRLWPMWGPSLVAVDCKESHINLGSKGRVKTLFSFWLPFTISKFRDLEFWSWRIGSIEATGHTLIRNGNHSCKLCFDMPWWAAAYLPVCWFALVKIARIKPFSYLGPVPPDDF